MVSNIIVVVQNMKEISNLMIFMVTEFMNGQMVKDMKANGIEIKCMAKEKLFGKMEENMKEIINMIKNTVMESLNGMMVEDMKVTGKMVNNMEEVSI